MASKKPRKELGTMGRSKNSDRSVRRCKETGTIIIMGLILGLTVWYGIKDYPSPLRREQSHYVTGTKDIYSSVRDAKRYQAWWRSPYRNSQGCEEKINSESLETVRNHILARRCIFNGGTCRELEECWTWCGCQRTTMYGYKRLIARTGGKFQTQTQTQNHRALTVLNPTIFSKGKGLVADRITVLLTLGLTVYAGRIVSHQGVWRTKCQMIGVLLMLKIPINQGNGQPRRSEHSREAPCNTGTEHHDAIMAGIICALIGAVMVCVFLGCSLKNARKYKRTDGVYLQIITERLSEIAYLGECAMPIDQVFQKNSLEPLIRELYVKHLFGTYLVQLVWGRPLYAIETVASGRAISLTLPGSVNISRSMANALREDPRAVRMARLLRYIGGLASVIPVGMPMISTAGWTVIGGREMREQEFPEFRPPAIVRSKSTRSIKAQRGVRHKNRVQGARSKRDPNLEVVYEIPLNQSQEPLMRPLPVRPTREGVTVTADITPV